MQLNWVNILLIAMGLIGDNMTVNELDEVLPIDYLLGTKIGSARCNSFVKMNYGNCQVESIEIDWENQDVKVWIKEN